jgi:hypothetical protein
MSTDAYIAFGDLVPDVVASYGTNADQRVQQRRAKLYREAPNSSMEEFPLTKMIGSNVGSGYETPEFKWSMEGRDDRYVTVTAGGAYKNTALNSAVGSTEQLAEDAYVYLKMPLASARQLNKWDELLLTLVSADDSDADHGATLSGQVTDRTFAGASSYLTVQLFHDDLGNGGVNGNVLGQFNAGDATLYVTPISPAMPEGSRLPWGRYREPTEKENYIQTIMVGLGLTGEELSNAQVFTEKTYNRYWKQVWHNFNVAKERALIWGTRRKAEVDADIGTGELQTLSQYRMGGLYWMFNEPTFGNKRRVFDIRQLQTLGDYDFSGKTWNEAGWEFFKQLMLLLSKKSGKTKKMYTSATAKQEIINFFESMAQVQVDSKYRDEWGFEVTRINGLNCTLDIHQHADFSCNPALEREALIIEPGLINGVHKKGRGLAVIRSVKELKSKQVVESGQAWRDAIQEGIFETMSIEVDNLDAMCWLRNLGRDFHA